MDANGGKDGGDGREPRRIASEEGEALTFPMSRTSETASRLKALISDKLHLFFNDYSDGTLAEYITVLVCNGRSQSRAKEDLKPFFGGRSEEFVTWLWELLREEFSRDKQDNSAFDPRITGGFGPCGTAVCEGSKSGPKDHNYGNFDTFQGLKAKAEKTSLPLVSATASIENEVSRKSAEVNYTNILWKKCINEALRMAKVINKDNRNSSAYNYSRKISSVAVPAFEQQDDIHSDKSEEIVPGRRSIIQRQHLGLPNIELNVRSPQSTPSGQDVHAGSYDAPSQKKKPRVSVWDRLGKPRDDLYIEIENPTMPEISIQTLENEVLHWHEPTFSAPNSEHIRRLQREVPAVHRRRESFRSQTTRQLETGIVTRSEPHMANNLARKRPSGDMGSRAEDFSGAKGGRGPLQYKEPSEDVKKPNLLPKQSAKLDLVSEVSEMKQKLNQIKMEISKLQSQQSKKQKVGEPEIQSQCGELHHHQDVDSRAVLVTNVHYAASKGAISMFFTQCGAVEDVEILYEQGTGNPAGAAVVKFAWEESIDKAIAMNGTPFYSRTMKVERMTEIDATAAATATSSQANVSGFWGEHTHRSHRLKWHRDSTTSIPTPNPAPARAPSPAPASAAVAVATAAPALAHTGTQRQAARLTTVLKQLSDSTQGPQT